MEHPFREPSAQLGTTAIVIGAIRIGGVSSDRRYLSTTLAPEPDPSRPGRRRSYERQLANRRGHCAGSRARRPLPPVDESQWVVHGYRPVRFVVQNCLCSALERIDDCIGPGCFDCVRCVFARVCATMISHGLHPFVGRLRFKGRLCVAPQVGPLRF